MKWINVEDRLPEIDYTKVYFTVDVLCTDGISVCAASFCSGSIPERWMEFSNYGYLGNITHWMPLPKPPEK